MSGAAGIMAGQAFIKLTAQDAELNKALQGTEKNLKAFAKTVEAVGAKLAVFGTLASAPFVAATKIFADFDDQMNTVASVTGATGAEFDALKEKAKQLGRETSFTAAQVAAGMAALGRMGFSSKEIESSIGAMMNLAKATGTDLATAAEIAANNMRIFNLDASKTGGIADLLTATANNSAQTLGDLGEALKMAGPQAAAAGENIKDVCTNLGIMANMGIRGSMAGTALRKAYSQFADTKVQDFLKQYNITTVDANGNLRKMETIIYDIAGAMAKMGSAEKLSFAEEVFDMRGAMAGLTLTADTSAIDAFKQKLTDTNGTAQATAERMESGIGGALRRIASAFEGVNIAVGETISKSILPFMENLAGMLARFTEWINANGGVVKSLAGISLGAAAAGTAIKALSVIAGALSGAFAPVKALLKTMDGLVTGTRNAAQAAQQQAALAAATEQQKTLAAQTSAAKRAEAEAARHAAEMQHASEEAAAVAASERAKMAAITANQGAAQKQMMESTQKIAAIQSEAAAQVAAERAKIAAMRETGTIKAQDLAQINARIASIQAEATAQISAEQLKQTGIRQTTVELQAQAAAQKEVLALAEANAANASGTALKAAANYKAATHATQLATGAEEAFMKSSAASKLVLETHKKAVGRMIASKMSYAITSQRVGNVIAQMSIKELATQMAVAKGMKSVTAALYAKAVAAKVANGAMGALRAAMTAVAAHPVTAAIVAMVAAVAVFNAYINRANANARKFAESAKKVSEVSFENLEKGDAGRQQAQVNFDRLKQLEELSQRGRLTADEIAETERLLKALQPFGATHYAQLDKATGQLKLAADAQNQFNQSLREAAKLEIEAQLKALEAERNALYRERDQIDKSYNYSAWAIITGKDEEAVARMEENCARTEATLKQWQAAMKRLKALEAGDQKAATGEKDEGGTQSRIEAENQRRAASVQELAEAEKALARIEDENAKKKLSSFEKEIQAIEKVRQEYMKNIDIKRKEEENLLNAAKIRAEQSKGQANDAEAKAYAAALAEIERHKKNIAMLDARSKAANADFDMQLSSAREKDAQPFRNFIGDLNAQQQKKDERTATDNRFANLLKQSQDGNSRELNLFMSGFERQLSAAIAEYQRLMKSFQQEDSEGGADFSETEKKQMLTMQEMIKASKEQFEGYKEQIRNAAEKATTENAAVAMANKKQAAAFDAAILTALFDRSGRAQLTQEERVARATEESARYNRQIAKNTAGGGLGNVLIG